MLKGLKLGLHIFFCISQESNFDFLITLEWKLIHCNFGVKVILDSCRIYVMRSSKMSLKSKNIICFGFFWHFLLGYCLGFYNLVKTPQRLGNWFQRYKQLKD